MAALIQAIFVKLYWLFEKNLSFRMYNRSLINENKWRAVRYGLDGSLIDFGKQQAIPARQLLPELVEFVDEVVDDLGSRSAVEYALQDHRGGHQRRSAVGDLPADRRRSESGRRSDLPRDAGRRADRSAGLRPSGQPPQGLQGEDPIRPVGLGAQVVHWPTVGAKGHRCVKL